MKKKNHLSLYAAGPLAAACFLAVPAAAYAFEEESSQEVEESVLTQTESQDFVQEVTEESSDPTALEEENTSDESLEQESDEEKSEDQNAAENQNEAETEEESEESSAIARTVYADETVNTISVNSYSELTSALSSAENGTIISLSSDITTSKMITIASNKELVLQFNGFSLINQTNTSWLMNVKGILELVGQGAIIGDGSSGIYVSGTLINDGVDIRFNTNTTNYGVFVKNGTYVQSDGSVVTNSSGYGAVTGAGSSEVEITGGSVSNNTFAGIYLSGDSAGTPKATVAGDAIITGNKAIFIKNKHADTIVLSVGGNASIRGNTYGIQAYYAGNYGNLDMVIGEAANISGGVTGVLDGIDGTLMIQGGTITGLNGLQISGGVDAVIYDGTITAKDTVYYSVADKTSTDTTGAFYDGAAISIVTVSGASSSKASLTIYGGSFVSESNAPVKVYTASLSNGSWVYNQNNTNLTALLIYGGDFTSNSAKVRQAVLIYGNTVSVYDISGGTWYLVDTGSIAVSTFAELVSAISNAATQTVIDLMNNITATSMITINTGQDILLNFNDYTLTGKSSLTWLMNVKGTLTLVGSGTINGNGAGGIYVSGTLNNEGVDITFTNAKTNYGVFVKKGSYNQTSGSVVSDSSGYGAVTGAGSSVIVISGGSVKNNTFAAIYLSGDSSGTPVCTILQTASITGKKGIFVKNKNSGTITLNVQGGTIYGSVYGIQGYNAGSYGPFKLNITGGSISSAGIAVQDMIQGTLNVTGGTITGATGIQLINNIQAKISGGTITGNSSVYNEIAYRQGSLADNTLAIDTSMMNTHNIYTDGEPIEFIVIHYTAGVTSRTGAAKNTLAWFNSIDTASATFCIDDTTICQYTDYTLGYRDWHCGGTYIAEWSGGGAYYGICTNFNSIGIEICSSNSNGYYTSNPNDPSWYFTDAVLDNAVALVRRLLLEFPDATVIRHYDTVGKLCPGIIGWNTYKGASDYKWQAFLARIYEGIGNIDANVASDAFTDGAAISYITLDGVNSASSVSSSLTITGGTFYSKSNSPLKVYNAVMDNGYWKFNTTTSSSLKKLSVTGGSFKTGNSAVTSLLYTGNQVIKSKTIKV